MKKSQHFETNAIRTQAKRSSQKEHSVPIYATSSFVFDNAEEARAAFAEEIDANIYSRFSNPNNRKENELISASWDDALETIAKRLLEIKSEHGSESIAFLGSSKCSNEENYLFQKIARTIIETNNLDNGGYMSGRLFS